MALDRVAVEQFLYREARLADEQRIDDWLALWDVDGSTYWVPCNKDDVDPERELSIIYDNYDRLRLRIERMKTGMAWTQEPRSKLRRLIGNIEMEEVEGEVRTLSNFHLTELRVNDNEPFVWVGQTEHRLRPVGDDFLIRYKKVLLINNDHEMVQLSCLI